MTCQCNTNQTALNTKILVYDRPYDLVKLVCGSNFGLGPLCQQTTVGPHMAVRQGELLQQLIHCLPRHITTLASCADLWGCSPDTEGQKPFQGREVLGQMTERMNLIP